MSKLILSSCDFRNQESAKCIYDNINKPIDKCSVLYFPNEKAKEEQVKSNIFFDRLSEFGFCRENIFVFNYYSPVLPKSFVPDVIYISGGNTFGTLKRLKESGADKIIVDYVKNGTIYIGGSAGAHIASSNISHIQKYDIDTFGLTDFSGLNLFEGILICHYTDERKKDYEKLKALGKYNVTALKDNEFIIVEV